MAAFKRNLIITIFTFAFLVQAVRNTNSSDDDDDDASQQGNESPTSTNQNINFDALRDILYTKHWNPVNASNRNSGNASNRNSGNITFKNPGHVSFKFPNDQSHKNSKYYYPGTEKKVAFNDEEEVKDPESSDDDDVVVNNEGPQKFNVVFPNDWEASTSTAINYRPANRGQIPNQVSSVQALREEIENTQRLIRRNTCYASLINDGYGNPNGALNLDTYNKRKTKKMSNTTKIYIQELIIAASERRPFPSPAEFCEEQSRRQSGGVKIMN